MAVTAKDCHALTSYFVKAFKQHHGREPNINRWSARWGFDAMLQGMSVTDVQALIDYYFTTPSDRLHDLEWFFYNYQKLYRARTDVLTDVALRHKLMEESKKRAEEWRKSGKRSITGTQRSAQEQ
jgi:hypothetical protein